MTTTPTPPDDPPKKATAAEVQARVSEVLRLRLAGAEFDDIRQYASVEDASTGRPWHVCDRQLWRYVALSDKALASAVEKSRDKLLARHLAQRRLIYAKAMETGAYGHALAALKDEADLARLYEAPAPDAPPELEPPKTAADVLGLLATVLVEVRAGKQEPGRATTTTTVAAAFLKALETTDIERRLAELEAQAAQPGSRGRR